MTVYKPAEDSFLLKNHIKDLDLEGKKVLDMGTGSGILAIEASKEGANVVAADINPEAIDFAINKAKTQGLDENIEFIESDLFKNVESVFEFIFFNPPYLPGQKGIGDEEIWYGGEKGIELTRKFLESSREYLSENGKLFVILSSHADWQPLIDEYDLEIIGSEKLWFETLYLARSK